MSRRIERARRSVANRPPIAAAPSAGAVRSPVVDTPAVAAPHAANDTPSGAVPSPVVDAPAGAMPSAVVVDTLAAVAAGSAAHGMPLRARAAANRRRRARAAVGSSGIVVAIPALLVALTATLAIAGDTDKTAAGKAAFVEVARVLQSPRCRNCHPAGDAPLQTDAGRRHAMNISRATIAAGVPCTTCHQERNSEAIGIAGGPPGAPHWGLPPAETPMVFEGRSLHALCEQLKDPAQNRHRSLADLLEHVSHDPLVQWAWSPGAARTKPPLDHAAFVAAFSTWVASNGACP